MVLTLTWRTGKSQEFAKFFNNKVGKDLKILLFGCLDSHNLPLHCRKLKEKTNLARMYSAIEEWRLIKYSLDKKYKIKETEIGKGFFIAVEVPLF